MHLLFLSDASASQVWLILSVVQFIVGREQATVYTQTQLLLLMVPGWRGEVGAGEREERKRVEERGWKGVREGEEGGERGGVEMSAGGRGRG